MASWAKKLEVPHTAQVSRWINYDIRPIEPARRTWGFLTFHNYWLLINTNISTYLTGSALIPLGLTWWQAFICIAIGNLLATLFVVLNSLPGAYYHGSPSRNTFQQSSLKMGVVGFPVVNRMVWGMWGSQFAIWNRIFLSLVWYGFTAWVGGECIYIILLSWDPSLEDHIPNHMPADTGMTTAQFVSYFIFNVISLPIIWIKPYKLQKFFYFASSITIVFFFVILIWALATMGPEGFGNTLASSTTLSNTGGPQSVAWLMVYGIVSTIGSISAGILNQNDYARFAIAPKHAIMGQVVPFPFYSILCSMTGILVTAATQNRFSGEAIWNLPSMFARLAEDGGPSARAGAFFAGVCLVISQIGTNVPGNALSGGFDLAATFPRFINIRRGAYITALLSVVVNPWRLVNSATTFLTVLSSYSVFLGPMTGLMVSSYLFVNKRKINVDDLYRGDKSSIYWFTAGVNWRAILAWLCGALPCLPGFIAGVNTSVDVPSGAIELYYLSYMYGFLSSGAVFVAMHRLFPAATMESFVKGSPLVDVVRRTYQKWDNTHYETGEVLEGEQGEDRLNIENIEVGLGTKV
ncbi:NCS1 nucleoside transporter family protein [Zopfia rhizophila CBS 207.26]|uniref:NCS1 nucleoside transporter family protein n=1 Tax=Zopfia rhizophila CBS 207.26 TaxID=1314779 RepID=A0A6A6ETL0_9PEZI|nr:NCS1 nucleoside transporter family protein [Zopfia rhizophila CBS 207.26]